MKKLISLFLIIVIISPISLAASYNYVPDLSEYSSAFAKRLNEWGEHESEADALNYLGLFKGSDSGYELSRTPTRIEALVTIIRLIGCESEALSQNEKSTFTDIPEWATAYAGYGQRNNIIKGVGGNLMGAQDPVDTQQYITMLLRVLDYNDDAGDFSFENSINFSSHINLITTQNAEHFAKNPAMIRGDMAYLMYCALSCPKNNGTLLILDLVKSGAINENTAYGTMLSKGESPDEIYRALSNGYNEAWLKQVESVIDDNSNISDIFAPAFKLSMYNWLKESGADFNLEQMKYKLERLTTKIVRPSADKNFSSSNIVAYFMYPNQIVVRSDIDTKLESSAFSHELRHALVAGMELLTLEEGMVELFNQEVDGGCYGYPYYFVNSAKILTHIVGAKRMNEIAYNGNYENVFYEIELKTGTHIDKNEFRKILYNISENAAREESWQVFTDKMSDLIYAYYMKNNAELISQSSDFAHYIDTLIALEQLMYFPSSMVRDAEAVIGNKPPSEYYDLKFEEYIYSILEDRTSKTGESINELNSYYKANRDIRYCAKYFGPDAGKMMIKNGDAIKITYKYFGSYYDYLFGRADEADEFKSKVDVIKTEKIPNSGFIVKLY